MMVLVHGEGVLELDTAAAAAAASRDDEDEPAERLALRVMLYYCAAPALAIAAAIGLFVLLRRWSRSPAYLIFTWQ